MLAAPAAAQTRLFSADAPVKIVITGPFPTLVRNASSSISPYPATLTVTDGDSPPEALPVKLRARGHTRRTEYCTFPPLELSFDKEARHGTLFKGQHKLKLVTYCRPPADYEQRIVLEYLTYRLYNLITPMSFRVRAAEVTYRSSEADAGVTRFGFLVEDISDVADRNGREPLKAASHQVSLSQLDAHATAEAALFEYMIANLDWEFLAGPPGTNCCHNSRFIAAPGATPTSASAVAPVPYDYDSSGFVDSPYATAPAALPDVVSVTDRYFRGYCATKAEFASAAQEYRDHRTQMMALIDGEPHLNAAFRAKTDRFMAGFFAVLDDPARFQRDIVGHCR
ncbi:MAG: hypothetical protein ACHP7N_05040 [Caulobacterales bacterium]